MRKSVPVLMSLSLGLVLWAQERKAPPTDPASHNMAGMPGMENDGSAHAMGAMEGHHMDMGPHMKMTALRVPQPGDQQRAQWWSKPLAK